ncbi:MAG: hypothetical protein QOH06_414 [Acidobacteriota bacterium]|nr:hypothetical protein [Acidobacteriota bacterium]
MPLGSTGSIAFYRVGYSDFAIWRSDGTPAGTFPVTSELSVPPSDLRLLAALSGGRLFFNACSPELGCELWSTDGSAAAPAGEIVPGPGNGEILELASAGGRAFLIAGTPGEPTALWLADAQGLKQLREVPDARSLVAQGNRAFFLTGGREVWTSDGTAAGTRRVADFPRQPGPQLGGLVLLDGRAYFTANSNSRRGRELWSTGPRPGSQRVLASIRGPYAWIGELEKSGDRIVFLAIGSDGVKLWSSRGSFQSTAQLTGCPGGCPHVYGELTPVAPGRFVFHGQNQEGGGIWVTDGTPAGTRLLQKTGLRGLTQAVAANGRVLIEVTEEYEVGELWVTNGTAAGTFLAARGGPTLSHYWGWSGSLSAGGANGRLVFPGFRDDEIYDVVLWSSDGSRDGSHPIVEPRTARGSHPYRLTPFRDGLLAWTCSGEAAELRFVQGTETTLLQSQAASDCPPAFYPPVVLGNAGNAANTGDIAVFLGSDGLWRTDGTPAGTQALFTDYPYTLARFGDEAAFSASTRSGNTYRVEIWLTDGTPEGTRKHLELPVDTDTLGLTFAGGRLWFFDLILLPDNEVVLRPWVSDGTPAGTYPLIEGYGLMPLQQFFIVEAGGRVWFLFARNGEPLAIWGSDGSPAGTGPVVTAESGAGAPEDLTAIGDRLYFTAPRADDPAGRLLPWISDGTGGGTELLADVTIGQSSFAPMDSSPFVELNGRVFFAAADKAHGDELWSTDGTPESTARLLGIAGIAPGLLGSHPRGLTAWNGRLWFRARDGVHGMELWSSDGTAAGTRFVQDIAPGASWSNPRELTATEGGLYFSANDGEHGRELWVVPDL